MYLQVKEIHASFVRIEEKLSVIDGKVEAVIR